MNFLNIIIKCRNITLSLYRIFRVSYRQFLGIEPKIYITNKIKNTYFGNKGYGGWAVPDNFLNSDSVVIDVGLGEDISFSEAIITKHLCYVHGFDPTPRSIAYIEAKAPRNFRLHKLGIADSNRISTYYLPNNPAHVSASITKTNHVGLTKIDVNLIDLDRVFKIIGKDKIDLLKIDIEGAEYELINSVSFQSNAMRIVVLCIEFHHRWPEFGPTTTLNAVSLLRKLGFECIWQDNESNEEFTFLNMSLMSNNKCNAL
jgi:FkbM family methyltransferase